MGYNHSPAGIDGYWGEITSTLDWCEENYQLTFYIAEFWNALSNLVFLGLAAIGCWSCHKLNVGLSHTLNFVFIGVIGIGSILFHSTLLYEFQLADELPIIYGTSVMVYVLVDMMVQSVLLSRIAAVAMAAYAVTVHVVYAINRNPVFHHSCHGILVLLCVFLPIRLILFSSPSAKPRLWSIYALSVASYALGFAVWSFENNAMNCDLLRNWRTSVGFPLGIVSELHSWWHLFSGYGAYGSCLLSLLIHLHISGRTDFRLIYYLNIIPVVQLSSGDLQKLKKTN